MYAVSAFVFPDSHLPHLTPLQQRQIMQCGIGVARKKENKCVETGKKIKM